MNLIQFQVFHRIDPDGGGHDFSWFDPQHTVMCKLGCVVSHLELHSSLPALKS